MLLTTTACSKQIVIAIAIVIIIANAMVLNPLAAVGW